MGERVRLADIIGSLSVICDMGFGLPPLNAVRSSLIATKLGKRIGLDEEDLRASFYAPLLLHIGCISMSHETAELFGNELAITRAVAMTNLGDPQDIVDTLIPQVTRGLDAVEREEKIGAIMTHAPTFGHHYDTASAEVSRQAAVRIGLPPPVQHALYECSETWHGEGAPRGLRGEDIAVAARITRIASDAAFFHHLGGVELAVEAIRARAGTLHDPSIADTFVAHAAEILDPARADEPAALLADMEPGISIDIPKDDMFKVVGAFGDAADLKTPYTHGDSSATAEIAEGAGARLGLDEAAIEDLRLAAFLHDVGRVAISNVVWEKPTSLNSIDWEEVRMHTYHAERVLARSNRLNGLARTVGMHHERLDGSGYHRGSRASEITMSARIIAVADAWVSMQQPRPHRAALDPDRAAKELQQEADVGRFDPQVVVAVLRAAGRTAASSGALPAGLSSREVDVLRLLAAGRSNPEIADQLHISRRTAEHHVQHIYRKIGVSTRPGAAMFALEHNLLEPLAS